jgi:hypothetical protein
MFAPLASAPPPSSDPMIIVVLGLLALIPVINGVLSIIRFFKADPPPHHYALTHDVDRKMDALESRVNARIALELQHINGSIQEIKSGVETLSKSVLKEIKEINRSIGKLEGAQGDD